MEEVEQKRWRRNDINEDGRKVQRERENQRHETRGTQRLPVRVLSKPKARRPLISPIFVVVEPH
jgi:hypothetical protein